MAAAEQRQSAFSYERLMVSTCTTGMKNLTINMRFRPYRPGRDSSVEDPGTALPQDHSGRPAAMGDRLKVTVDISVPAVSVKASYYSILRERAEQPPLIFLSPRGVRRGPARARGGFSTMATSY